jgi:hypothetical protein
MSSFTDYLEQKIIGYAFAGESWTPPATWYLALYTASPGEAGGGTECTGGAYARISCAFSRSGSSVSNSAVAEFPVSTANRSPVTAVGIVDASTGGNLVAYKVFDSAKDYNIGQSLKFLAGGLTITLG